MSNHTLQSYREKMDRIEKQLEQLRKTYTREFVIRNTSDQRLNVDVTMEEIGKSGDSFVSRIQVPENTQYIQYFATEINSLAGKEKEKGNGESLAGLQRGSALKYKEKPFSTQQEDNLKGTGKKEEPSTSKIEQKISDFEQNLRNPPDNTTSIKHQPHLSPEQNQSAIKRSESSLILSDMPSQGDIRINSPQQSRQAHHQKYKLTDSFQIEPNNEDYRPFSLSKPDTGHKKNKQPSSNQQSAKNLQRELNYQYRNEDMRERSKSDRQFKQRHLNAGASLQKKHLDKVLVRNKIPAQTDRSRDRSVAAFSPLRKTFEDCKPKSKITISPDIKINTPVKPKRADQLYLERHNSFLYSKGTPKPKDSIFPRERSQSDHNQSSNKKITQDKYKISPKAQEVTDRLHSKSNKKIACEHQSRFSTRNSREKFDQMVRDNSFALRNLNKREREILFNNLKEKGDSVEVWPKHIVNFAYYKFKQSLDSQPYINI